MPDVIVNTSPLVYLHQAGLLHVLPDIYSSVIVPEAVATEMDRGLALGHDLPEVRRLSWARVHAPTPTVLLRLATRLGSGEREVLALGAENAGALVILDDGEARAHARLLGLKLTGTLGVLLRARRDGVLPALRPALDRLERLRFRMDAATRAELLRLAGE